MGVSSELVGLSLLDLNRILLLRMERSGILKPSEFTQEMG
jgi:hypothetical protein